MSMAASGNDRDKSRDFSPSGTTVSRNRNPAVGLIVGEAGWAVPAC